MSRLGRFFDKKYFWLVNVILVTNFELNFVVNYLPKDLMLQSLCCLHYVNNEEVVALNKVTDLRSRCSFNPAHCNTLMQYQRKVTPNKLSR